MPQRISPNRRRSIAVLGNGPSTSRATQKRRRAYSMAPGEKLSPAARARTLVPRKSILKDPTSARPSQESASTSATIDDSGSNNVTMTMEFTEVVRPSMSRKSLGRRVSFASHAHVRLFEKQDPNASGEAGRVGSDDDNSDEDEDIHLDQDSPGAYEESASRRTSRRRSSTGFSEMGERSMEMDEDDTGPIPQDFLNGPALHEEQFNEGFSEDMDMTTIIPGSMGGRPSLGLADVSLPGPRRSSTGPIVTSSHSQSENRRPLSIIPRQDEQQPPQRLYPSLEDLPDPSMPMQNPDDSAVADMSDMDLTMGSVVEHTVSSNGDENTQPMEFTIPVVRPPPPPSQLWLNLHAITHSGAEEPYAHPEIEASDDPEANAIVSTQDQQGESGEGDSMELTVAFNPRVKTRPSLGLPPLEGEEEEEEEDDSMDLTVALNRLAKARPSLGLPPINDDSSSLAGDDKSVEDPEDDWGLDETFTSNGEDMSLGSQTLNFTNLRISVGGHASESTSGTEIANRQEEVSAIPGNVEAPLRNESSSAVQPVSQQPEEQQPGSRTDQDQSSVTKLPNFSFTVPPSSSTTSSLQPGLQPQKQPQPSNAVEHKSKLPLNLPIFTPLPRGASTSQSTSRLPQPPRSPAKSAQSTTSHTPFTFTVPSRLNARSSPAKATSIPPNSRASASPTKRPANRGTAAFALSTAKSPRKRPPPPDDGDRDAPSPAKKQAVEKLAASTNPQTTILSSEASQNRRQSGVRRPSGYFAQRKSLGGSAPQPAAAGVSKPGSTSASTLSKSVSAALPAINFQKPSAVGASLNMQKPLDDPRPEAEDISASSVAPEDSSSTNVIPEIRIEYSVSPNQPSLTASLLSSTPNERNAAESTPALPTVPRRSQSPLAPQTPAEEPERRVSTKMSLSAHESRPDYNNADDEMEMTEQWGDDALAEDDEPTISIEQFFEMTNIKFMDEITAPRRSMVLPGHLGLRNRRRSLSSSHSETTEQIPLAEFMTAMAVDVPQLELYHDLAHQLTAWVEESKKICRQAEEDAIKVTPALFREFADADELEKQDLLHQLKLIKSNNIDSAKSQWYDWKATWVAQLQESAEEAFAELESDAKSLEGIINQAQSILPSLREEYAQIMAELEKEEADIAEIENSDKNFLSDLKVSIAEQDVEVQALQANVSEAQAKLNRLEERDHEIQLQKQELEAGIVRGQELIQRQTASTSSEVLRLKDELEALEDLHLWRATRLDANLKEFIYASRFHVSIPCVAHRPDVSWLRVERTKASRMKERDEFPELSELMLTSAQHIAAASRKEVDLRTIVQRLSDFWASCAQIRLQLTFLAVQYPLELKLHPSENGLPTFEISVKVLFPSVKSKANITFIMDADTYSRWPLSIGLLKADVTVAYGRADRQKILEAVQSRLSQATSSDNHGCLLDACIEATEQLAFA